MKKKKRREKTERNKAIKRALKTSSTRKVAKRYNISNKRVWDIANK